MKNFIIIILLIVSVTKIACSMSSRSIIDNQNQRDISKTFFWADKEKGVFVTQTCKKYKKNKCKEWVKRYLTVEKDWEYIRNSKMILINESFVLKNDFNI